jgi:hypothetical protein
MAQFVEVTPRKGPEPDRTRTVALVPPFDLAVAA